LAKVKSIDSEMDSVPHFIGIQDLDLDGRDKAFSGPSDLVISVHGVVIGKSDKGHADPPRFLVERQRIHLPGRDDVARMKCVNMEVDSCPAPGY